MLKVSLQRGIRFGYVGIDGGYGKEPAFLRAVDRLGCRFVADVHCDQMICLQDPEPKIPDWKGRGKRPKHLKAQCDAMRVDQWASEQSAKAWQRLTLREGEKGDLTAEYLHALIWVWDDSKEKARYGTGHSGNVVSAQTKNSGAQTMADAVIQ